MCACKAQDSLEGCNSRSLFKQLCKKIHPFKKWLNYNLMSRITKNKMKLKISC